MNKEEFIKYIIDILIYPDEFKIDEDGDQCFYKNGLCYFSYDIKNDILYYSEDLIKKECGFNFSEIKDSLKHILLKYFKMDKTTVR